MENDQLNTCFKPHNKEKIMSNESIYILLLSEKDYKREDVKKYLLTYLYNYLPRINESKQIADPVVLRLARNREDYNEFILPIFKMDYSMYIDRLKSLIKTNSRLVYENADRILNYKSYFYDKSSKVENLVLESYINNCMINFANNNKQVNAIFKFILFKKLAEEEISIKYNGLSWHEFYHESLEKSKENPGLSNKSYLKQKYDMYICENNKERNTIFAHLDGIVEWLHKAVKPDRIYLLLWLIFENIYQIIEKNKAKNNIAIQNMMEKESLFTIIDIDFYLKTYRFYIMRISSSNYGHSEAINLIASLYDVFNGAEKRKYFDDKYSNYYCNSSDCNLLVRNNFDDKIDDILENNDTNIKEYAGLSFEYHDNGKRKDLETIIMERQDILNNDYSRVSYIPELKPLIEGKNACVCLPEDKERFDSIITLYNEIIKRSIRKIDDDIVVNLARNNKDFGQIIFEILKNFEGDAYQTKSRIRKEKMNDKTRNMVLETLDKDIQKYRSLIDKLSSVVSYEYRIKTSPWDK